MKDPSGSLKFGHMLYNGSCLNVNRNQFEVISEYQKFLIMKELWYLLRLMSLSVGKSMYQVIEVGKDVFRYDYLNQ